MKSIFFASAALSLLTHFYFPSQALAAPEVACVWTVKSDTNTIYLAASLPFLREADLPLPAPFRQAYDASKRVVFEVDPKESKDEEEGQKVIRLGMFTDGGSIKDSVSKETYKKLGDFVSGTGAPRAAMDQFRPWFAAIMISMTEMMKQGIRPDLGVGEVIEDWAVKDGKPIAGLESMRVELDILRGLPKEAHEQMLKSTLDEVGDPEQMEKEFEEYLAAWRRGDVAALEELDSEEQTEWDELMNKRLWRERAAKWMKQFDRALSGDEPSLYVLGIGHLVGDGNLLEKLAKKGYQVEPLEAVKPDENKKDEKKKPALIPVVLH